MIIIHRKVMIKINSKNKKGYGLQKINKILILTKNSIMILIDNTIQKIKRETIMNQKITEPKINIKK